MADLEAPSVGARVRGKKRKGREKERKREMPFLPVSIQCLAPGKH